MESTAVLFSKEPRLVLASFRCRWGNWGEEPCRLSFCGQSPPCSCSVAWRTWSWSSSRQRAGRGPFWRPAGLFSFAEANSRNLWAWSHVASPLQHWRDSNEEGTRCHGPCGSHRSRARTEQFLHCAGRHDEEVHHCQWASDHDHDHGRRSRWRDLHHARRSRGRNEDHEGLRDEVTTTFQRRTARGGRSCFAPSRLCVVGHRCDCRPHRSDDRFGKYGCAVALAHSPRCWRAQCSAGAEF